MMHGILIFLAIFLLPGSTWSETIVQLGSEYSDHNVKEGYSGAIETIQRDIQLQRLQNARSNPGYYTTELASRHPYDHGDVVIADVKASIHDDADYDGYYTQFSLNFDVDSDYGYEYVYARIYLRSGNDDYQLFHVTEVFEIYSDLISDRYKVDSKLVRNFPAAHYDVRIEILIAGQTGVQDTVDASSHRSLRDLPLESERYDGTTTNGDIIVHEHTGAFSAPMLLVLLFGIAGTWLRRQARP